MIRVRPARPDDAAAMAAILAPHVVAGRSTAIEAEVDEAWAGALLAGLGPRDFCLVAEEGGRLLGWQLVEAMEGNPPDAAEIATFVAAVEGRRGVGRALLSRTLAAAPALGWRALRATIRADNSAGRAFYAAMEFRPAVIRRALPLRSGRKVDRWLLVRAI